MKAIDNFRLLVSGLTGTVYMAKPSKKPHIMTDNRRVIPDSEFYDAIIQHVNAKIKKGHDTLSITTDGKVVCEIKLFRENI